MKQRRFGSAILLILLSFLCVNLSYAQTTYTVSNTSPTITTPNGLHWAIDQANNNPGVDIIEFSIDGTIDMLTNTFVITEGVVIDGTTAPGYVAGAPSFILDRNGGTFINTSGSPTGLEINGLGFTNQNANQNGSLAMLLSSCTDLTVQNNEFTGIGTALDVNLGSQVSITDNDFNSCGYANNRYTVEISGLTGTDPATRLILKDNEYVTCGSGINLDNMDGLAIDPIYAAATTEVHLPDGTLEDLAFTALAISNSDNITLDDLDISNTSAVSGIGLLITNGNNITVQNLTINNKATGIQSQNNNAVIIQDNTIDNVLVASQGGRGILLSGGEDAQILDNTIRQYGRANNQYALTIDNVSDNGSGDRLVVNGTTFDGGGNAVALSNMDAMIIDNVNTATPGQGVHLPDADGRQGMFNVSLNLFNMDNTTINNFDLSYTGGTVSGQALNTNGCDNFTVTNNTIDNRSTGFLISNSNTLLIEDNTIDNVLAAAQGGRGIFITGGQDVEILDNTIRQMGRTNNQYALSIDGVADDGSGNRLIVNGTTFDGGGNGVSLANMDALTIDNVLTGAPGQGVHLPDSDGRQGMYNVNMNLFNIDNTTINNFDLSYTGGTTSGSGLNTNGCDNLTVTNNTVNDRGQGIYCLNSNNLLVEDNTVSNILISNSAGRGIWISGGSDVEVLDNTINNMGRANSQYALVVNNVADNGSGQRLVVNGTTFGGAGGFGVSIENMDALTIDNVASTGQGVHIPDTDGRQNVYGVNMNLFNIDNTTINNFDLSYTGGTVAGSGLNTNACDNLNITNNTFNNRGQGIYCLNNSGLLVQNNDIDNVLTGNAGRGIWISGGNDVEVLNNTIKGHGIGNNIYALTINNVVDNGSGQRIVVNGTTFVGGADAVSLESMDGVIIDNVASTGQGIHLPDTDGRQGMTGTNMQLFNIDNTTLNNFNLSYTGGLSGQGLRAINCDVLTIQDFTISGRGSGMFFQNCPSSSILNNTISGGNGNGIDIFQGNNYIVQNNSVSDFTSGNNFAAYKYRNIVEDGMGNRLSALDNSFSNNNNGIFVGSMDDMIISDGTVADSEIILKTGDNYGTDINGIKIFGCTNTRIENLAYKGDASAVTGTAIFYDVSTTSLTSGVSISHKGTGVGINRNEGHVIQQSLFESNSFGVTLTGFNVTTNYTVSNNNFSCNGEAIRANQYAVVDAANNFWGQPDGSSTDSGSGDIYAVIGNAPNTGIINNTTTLLTSENTSVPIGGRKIFNGVTAQLTDGQTTTSVADSTDYETVNTGTTKTRQFRIVNSGIDSLHISSIVSSNAAFTIANAPDFVLCEDSVAFDVIFAPTAGTTYNSTITVNQEDCYNTNFEFAVAGVGFSTCDIAITSATPTDEGCPGADDGEIDVVATCASCTSIEYSIDDFATMNTTGDFTGLADGTYTVKVRDSGDNSCAAEMMNVAVGAGSDAIAPTISCNDITVDLDPAGTYTLTASDLEALAMGSTDDCSDFSALTITSTPSAFDCDDVAGQANNLALAFDESTTGNGADYVQSVSNVSITGNADRTLEFWVRMNETNVFNEHMVNWGSTGTGAAFGFYQTNNSELEFYTHNAPGGWDYSTGHFFDQEKWYHIAASYIGSTNTVSVYIDGVPAPVPTYTLPGAINTTAAPMILASRPDLDAATFSTIDLDEVRVWDYARTQSEIMADMNIALNGNESGLVLYYDMELDGTGTTNLVDKAGSNDGTLINMDPANDWIASGSPVFSGGTPVVLEVTDENGNTSTSTCAITVTVNTNLTVSTTATAETCMDNDDGQITTTVTGGTGPYTFTATRQGDGSTLTLTGTSPQTFMNLVADVYIIEVEDNGGCSGTTTETVAESATPCCDIAITSVTPTDEVCSGADDGALEVVATCTTCSTIEYSIDNTTWMNGSTFTGLADATYTVYVRDSLDHTCNTSSAGHVVGAGDNTDTDDDDVPDCIDLDDDNDGILDVDELECGSTGVPSSTPITITETFGSGSDPGPAITDISNSYTYSTGPTNDGFYSIATDSDLYDDFGASNNVWSMTHGVGDNTGDTDGYFLLINGSAPGQEAYRKTFNIVSNSDFSVSVALINLGSNLIIKPNLTLRLENSNGDLLDLLNTGNLENSSWESYTLTGTTSNDTQVDLVIVSNSSSGTGNDYGVDDVSITYLPLLCDSDGDNISDTQELDSDGDGCYDVAEAGYNDPDDDGILGTSPVTVDAQGLVVGEGGYTGASNQDAENPMTICQDITIYLDGAGMATITASDVDGGSSDNCGGVTLSIDSTNFDCTELGANSVVLTAEDGNGNTSSCTATVTVQDTIAPTAICQDVTVNLDGNATASITANDIDNGSNDNCSVSSTIISMGQTSFGCSDVGNSYSITLRVEDASGNVDSCMASVTITDTNNECCDIAIDAVVATDESCVGEDDGMLTVTASCTTCTTIEYSTDSTTWSTSNVLMGLADGTYTVYVRDSGDAECNASNSANNVIAEGVPPSTWYIDEDGDGFGASSVVDCNRPTDGLLFSELDPLSNGTDDCNDQDANVNFNQTEIAGNGVDDNCNGAIDEVPTATWVALPNGTSTGGNGTCVSATDCCTQTFCFGLEYNPGSTGTLTSYTSGFITDCTDGVNSIVSNASCVMTDNSMELVDCNNGGVLMNSSGVNGTLAITVNTPVIIHQICVTVLDEDTKTFMEDVVTDISMAVDLTVGPVITEYPEYDAITVEGNKAPVLTAGTIDAFYPDVASAEAAAIAATTGTDDCPGAVTFTADTDGSCSAVITVTGADECGLTSTVTYTTTIDGTAPVISGAAFTYLQGCSVSDAPSAVSTVADLMAINVSINVSDDCTDNVDIDVTSNDVVTNGCPINITRTYSLTDEAGNTSTLNHFIVIDDQVAPAIVGMLDAVEVDACGGASSAPAAVTTVAALEALDGNPAISDNCSMDVDLVVTHEDEVSGTCPVIISRTYTIADPCGNESFITQMLQVNPPDDIMESGGPVATMATMQSSLYATPPPALPVIIDGCGQTLTPTPVVIGGTYEEGDCKGTITYTYTYEDCVGRTFDWVYTNDIDCGILNVKLNLEGAYDGTEMTTQLHEDHLLPGMDKSLSSSFSIQIGAPYTPFGQPYQGAPWNYTGNLGANYGEATSPGAPAMVTAYPDHVVDWVLVSVRENTTDETGSVFTCAGWLHTNGDVTFPETCPDALTIDNANEYYIVVEHRNHLPALDTAMIMNTNEYLELDLTQSDSYAPIFRFGQKEIGSGVWGLYGANIEQTTSKISINSADQTGWKIDQGKFGYRLGDVDMSGATGSDDETKWKFNQNITSGIKF